TISRLSRRLAGLDDVMGVASLSNALIVRGSEFGIDIESWDEMDTDSPEQLAAFRRHVLSNPMYAGTLVAADAGATAILVSLADKSGYEFLSGIERAVRDVISAEAPQAQIWVTGPPILNLATTNTLLGDLLHIPALVVLVMAVVLALCFRSVSGILVPLTTVGIAVIWAMALTALLGYTLNIVTVLVPTLLMIICLSYAIHVVAEFRALGRRGETGRAQAAGALRGVFLPVVFTGLTTAIGFLSLTLSPLAAISEFGVLAVIGILTAMVVTLTYTPAVLTLLLHTRPRQPRVTDRRRHSLFDRLAVGIGQTVVRHRMPVFIIAGIVFVIVLAGMTQIRVGIEYITNFDRDTPVRQAYEKANTLLGGANLFYVVVESGNRDAIKEPLNLLAIRELQTWLNEQPEIGGSLSLVDYLEQLNSAFHDNDPARRQIPDSKKEIGQLLFFGASDELETLVDSRYQTANVVVRTRAVNSDELSALVGKINARLQQLPGHLQATVTGTPVLFDSVLDRIIRGQTQSMFAALAIVYLVLVGMFLSFRIGLIALLPNIFPIVTYYGALGYLGISLNPSNSLIAPMVLGIAIDDTVHYFARFNEFMKRRTDSQQAAIESLRIVGRPVTYTTVALCLGFLMLTGSELKMQEQVGLLACFALAFAWLTDFTLTPALCSRLRIATIWDALTLDLGR
ncbi:MAG: efflux RND transporter permease subunit, partial [Thiohalobacterales bacterium]|nr:efflux RND transporter permease subunit [Thiohalobacterales bacterium]